jgi:hypothetical protein
VPFIFVIIAVFAFFVMVAGTVSVFVRRLLVLRSGAPHAALGQPTQKKTRRPCGTGGLCCVSNRVSH